MEDNDNTRPDAINESFGEKLTDLTRESQAILKILVDSKETGSTMGICSLVLGDGFFITGVEDIILMEGETIILIKPFDVTGFVFPTNKLRLTDITAACPLRSEYENPILKNFDKDRKWYF